MKTNGSGQQASPSPDVADDGELLPLLRPRNDTVQWMENNDVGW